MDNVLICIYIFVHALKASIRPDFTAQKAVLSQFDPVVNFCNFCFNSN